ncbi:MAG: hypothetical protein M3Y81_01705 [Chloroflexota bacterium]|nr:hypothetical protein [Chloroflexota bacterium]
MKRRKAYAEFEKIVIELYEQHILTLEHLDYLASLHHQVGIDSAGSQRLLAKDGKDVHQVCIELVDPSFPLVAGRSNEHHEEYWEGELRKWEEIVHERWDLHRGYLPLPIQVWQEEAA